MKKPPGFHQPLEIALEMILEDPRQPRTEFDAGSLQELADSITLRGVKTPVSVRPYGEKFILNHGARRWRASKLAGKKTIPAYVDADYTDDDQVSGLRQIQIAAALGKSKTFVSQHAALLDLPEVVNAAYQAERVTDVTLINELANLFGKDPETVEQWLGDTGQDISRGSVSELRDYIKSKGELQPPKSGNTDVQDPDEKKSSTALRRPVLMVQVGESVGRLLFNRRSSKAGHAWVLFGAAPLECLVAEIRLLSVGGK